MIKLFSDKPGSYIPPKLAILPPKLHMTASQAKNLTIKSRNDYLSKILKQIELAAQNGEFSTKYSFHNGGERDKVEETVNSLKKLGYFAHITDDNYWINIEWS